MHSTFFLFDLAVLTFWLDLGACRMPGFGLQLAEWFVGPSWLTFFIAVLAQTFLNLSWHS